MNRRIGMGILVLVVVGGSALGCQPGASFTPPPDETVPPMEQPTTSPAQPTPGPTRVVPPAATPEIVVPAKAEVAVALARADLARRLGLKTEAAIAVASVTAVDWPSTALGCPEPGKMYADVITPGYRVVLAAQGNQYEYHTDQGTRVVLCVTRAGDAPVRDTISP